MPETPAPQEPMIVRLPLLRFFSTPDGRVVGQVQGSVASTPGAMNGTYLGPNGYTGDLAAATDFRGQAGATIIEGETVEVAGPKGDPGADGKSALQIWQEAGNAGGAEEFLGSLKGAPGEIGPRGPRGDVGPNPSPEQITAAARDFIEQNADEFRGPAGPAGADSTIPGPKGDKGDRGEKGEAGAASTAPGPKGEKGDTGAASTVPGPKGDKGEPGAASTVPGPKGDKGDTGAASTVPGPKGDTGAQGAAGFGSVAAATATRALNTTFQPHATKAVYVAYTIRTQVTNPLLVGTSTATAILLSEAKPTGAAANWAPLTERARVESSSGVGLTVTIALTTSNTMTLSYIVPAGDWVRLASSVVGTGAVSIVSQVEEVVG